MTDANNEAEILEYLRAFPDATFSEVAQTLNIDRNKVSSVAHKNGIYRRPRRKEMLRRCGKRRVRRTGTDLESEVKIVEYIKSHPKESYPVIGKRFGYAPGRLSQLARAHGIVRYASRGQGEKKRREYAKFLRKNTHIQVTENAKTLGISTGYVSTIAAKYGLRRQAPKGSGLHIVGRVVRRTGALAIPSDHELNGEIRQAEQRLQQLRARKASHEIRIEEDGDTITVYGVGEPIARHRADWLRWLKASGAASLRERCSNPEQASSAKVG